MGERNDSLITAASLLFISQLELAPKQPDVLSTPLFHREVEVTSLRCILIVLYSASGTL